MRFAPQTLSRFSEGNCWQMHLWLKGKKEKKEKNPRWYFLSLHIKNSINSLRADRRNFQVCLKVTVLFLLFHIETRASLLPLTKFSTARTDPFNNSPIDFKLTRTRYRTENFPCCERKGVTTTLAFWLHSLSRSPSPAHLFFLSLDDKGLFLRRTESLSGFGQLGKVIWGPNWCTWDSQ